jgi:hypothetical protein
MTRRFPNLTAGALAALLAVAGARTTGDQPEVNNPPEIEEFTFSFGVAAGNLLGIDTSEPRACTRVKVNFEVTVRDYEGDLVIVTMDLDGDGKLDDAKRKVKGAGTVVASRRYSQLETIELRFRACDKHGACSSVMRTDFEVIACPPEFVEIMSDVEMHPVGKTALMTLTSRDVQGDKITYEIDWDEDNVYEFHTKPSAAGEPVEVSHTYDDHVIHWVDLRVCDSRDGCSDPEQRKF